MWYKDGKVFGSQTAIRNNEKEKSLPSFLNNSIIAELGYKLVVELPQPEITELQTIVEGSVEVVNGVPTKGWVISDKFSDTAEYVTEDGTVVPAKTKAEQEAEYLLEKASEAIKAVQADFTKAIQDLLDGEAEKAGYDSIVSACSYAGYPNKFQEEAIKFGTWRSSVWDKAYSIMDEVKSGIRAMPTLEEVFAELPTL